MNQAAETVPFVTQRGHHRVTLSCLRMWRSVQLSSGDSWIRLSHVLSFFRGGVKPQTSSPLSSERVESSKLCIDKGRHRSAFRHSVNEYKKNKKKNHCKFGRIQIAMLTLLLRSTFLVTLICVFSPGFRLFLDWTLTSYSFILFDFLIVRGNESKLNVFFLVLPHVFKMKANVFFWMNSPANSSLAPQSHPRVLSLTGSLGTCTETFVPPYCWPPPTTEHKSLWIYQSDKRSFFTHWARVTLTTARNECPFNSLLIAEWHFPFLAMCSSYSVFYLKIPLAHTGAQYHSFT